jgi:hypothetical protein
MQKDEIIFSGAYKSFKLGVNFDVTGKEPKDVAAILGFIGSRIEPDSFKFAGVNMLELSDISHSASGKGLASVYGFLEAHPPKELKGMLEKAVPDPALVPAAESCLFSMLLTKAGVGFKATSGDAPFKPKDEEPGDVIAFIGRYGQWMAVKKLGLEKVQDYEVSAILASVNNTLVGKSFDFAGMKRDDATVAAIAGGKRRSIGNVGMALRELEPKLGGGDDAYLVCKTLEALGYKPYASPEMLTNAHPDIKPPKVKGRKPKG